MPTRANGPRSMVNLAMGGQFEAMILSRTPQCFSRATPGVRMKWVDMVSLGNVALSTSNTR